jgi:hypothetical protein
MTGPQTLAQLWPAMRAAGRVEPEIVALRRRLLSLSIRTAAVDRQTILVLAGLSPPRVAGGWWPEVTELTGADAVLTAKGRPDAMIAQPDWAAARVDAMVLADPALSLPEAVALLESWKDRRQAPRWLALDGAKLVALGLDAPVLAAEVMVELLHREPRLWFGHEGTLWREV